MIYMKKGQTSRVLPFDELSSVFVKRKSCWYPLARMEYNQFMYARDKQERVADSVAGLPVVYTWDGLASRILIWPPPERRVALKVIGYKESTL